MDHMPFMFLPQSRQRNSIWFNTGSRYGGRGAPGTTTTNNKEVDDDDVMKLGFDVRLGMAASSIDSQKWNAPETTSLSSSSPLKNSLFRKQQQTSTFPGWFPWIPTRAQIEALKVVELKEACDERGLKKTGRKADLQQRLWEWAQEQHRQRIVDQGKHSQWNLGLALSDVYRPRQDEQEQEESPPQAKLKANSLEEWARNVDDLRIRREAIRRNKEKAKKPPSTATKRQPPPPPLDYRLYLKKAFEAPSSQYSNRDVKQMYKAAKLADQAGDREAAKTLLQTLLEATPKDGRIFRRLARMHAEEGHLDDARATLQEGLRRMPDNAHLWHGLGQMESSSSNVDSARRCYREAIRLDPTLPNPHHALGTLEHTHGHIAVAKKVLKRGIEYCPTNHRLHHALGDLYREAKMLDVAETCYRRALKHGPRNTSHGFAYTALASVAYEYGKYDECRSWLRQSVSLNDGRHAQGWTALAQMEESLGHVDAARGICIGAIAQYERGLLQRKGVYEEQWWRNKKKKKKKENGSDVLEEEQQEPECSTSDNDNNNNFSLDLLAMKETLFRTVPQYRSGDKFIHVFRNWARLEETYGCPETVDEVYTRASFAFPHDWKLLVNWAQYHTKTSAADRARVLFGRACGRAKNRHADPHRIHAEFEMSFGNYAEARSILFRGARAMSTCADGGLGNRSGMAELFHTWAVCEWHLGNLSRAEELFDYALRMTDSGEGGSKLRSFILYSIAHLQYHRGEYEVAQHCIGLCLKENLMPGGNSKIWKLWEKVASAMGNDHLEEQCRQQALQLKREEEEQGMEGLSRLLSISGSKTAPGLSKMVDAASQPLMRRDPWHEKLFGDKTSTSLGFFQGVKFPDHPGEERSEVSNISDATVGIGL